MTTTIEPATGNHHLDGDLAQTPPAAEPVAPQADPELPIPGAYEDRRMAGYIADYALAKLRRYVAGSSEISSHFIELSIRLAEVYARLGEASSGQQEQPPEEAVVEAGTDDAQSEFEMERQEAEIEQHLAASESS